MHVHPSSAHLLQHLHLVSLKRREGRKGRQHSSVYTSKQTQVTVRPRWTTPWLSHHAAAATALILLSMFLPHVETVSAYCGVLWGESCQSLERVEGGGGSARGGWGRSMRCPLVWNKFFDWLIVNRISIISWISSWLHVPICHALTWFRLKSNRTAFTREAIRHLIEASGALVTALLRTKVPRKFCRSDWNV